jgi:hypothetical protein
MKSNQVVATNPTNIVFQVTGEQPDVELAGGSHHLAVAGADQ